MIKIISGYSHAAGSTLALVNLCNEFNTRGHTCTFYGPDNWHMGKCQSGNLDGFSVTPNDIVIANDMPLLSTGDLSRLKELVSENGQRHILKTLGKFASKCLPAKIPTDYRLILTRLSDDSLPISNIRFSLFQNIHSSSSCFGNYSKIGGKKFVAQSFFNDLKASTTKPKNTAGIIGSIKRRNNIEESIEQALMDGMETIYIFGYMKDPIYFYEKITPLTIKYRGQIKYAGFVDDKQKMYDAISDVYSSANKPWSLVRRECVMTNTGYHAPESKSTDHLMTNEQIFQIWKTELAL